MALQIRYEKKTRYPGITEVGPSRYRLRVRYVDPKTGRRKQKIRVFEGTLNEAVVEQARLHGKEEQPATSERKRLGDYAESWLRYKASVVRPSTGRGLAWQLGHHVEPHLGEYWVDAITPADIRQWQSRLRSSGLAPATINAVHRSLRNLFDTAVADGLIVANPAKAVHTLREGRTRGPRGTVLTPDQLGAFLKAGATLVEEGRIAPDIYTMLAVLALCGLRFGELAAAKWSDLQDGMLRVERAVWNRHVDATKTDDPRVVLVPRSALDLLQAHRQRQIAEQHPALSLGLMFPSNPRQATVGAKRRGTEQLNWYRYPACLSIPIARITERAGIPLVSPHALRRTWDRWTRWAGVDHMARRAMAGWRTEDAHAIYSNVDPEEARPAMEHALEKIMGGKG